MSWTPWRDGDDMPKPGDYWVTGRGLHGPETFKEMLHDSEWRYRGVTAYMAREHSVRPPPYIS